MPLLELASGPSSTLLDAAAVGGLMPLIIALIKFLQKLHLQSRHTEKVNPGGVETTTTYLRYVLASLSGNTQYGWDHHVRPILATLAASEASVPQHWPTYETLRERLGDNLYQHVDPTTAPCSDRSIPGPGIDTLSRILDSLEIT
jgi:hypothetical protein